MRYQIRDTVTYARTWYVEATSGEDARDQAVNGPVPEDVEQDQIDNTPYEVEARPVVRCDGVGECPEPIAYIDHKGYAYCAAHGRERQTYTRCRKLRPAELRRILAGEALERY